MSFPIVQTPGGSYLITKLVRGTFSTIVCVYNRVDPISCVERHIRHRDVQSWYPQRAVDGFNAIHKELIQEWVEKYEKKRKDDPRLPPAPDGFDEVHRILHVIADDVMCLIAALRK